MWRYIVGVRFAKGAEPRTVCVVRGPWRPPDSIKGPAARFGEWRWLWKFDAVDDRNPGSVRRLATRGGSGPAERMTEVSLLKRQVQPVTCHAPQHLTPTTPEAVCTAALIERSPVELVRRVCAAASNIIATARPALCPLTWRLHVQKNVIAACAASTAAIQKPAVG
jgi:hypothetical protein